MRGGILLQVLLLSLIFSLLLQFYLQAQVTARRQNLLMRNKMTAEIMVMMAKQEKLLESGHLIFDKGELDYQKLSSKNKENLFEFKVHLKDGSIFNFKK